MTDKLAHLLNQRADINNKIDAHAKEAFANATVMDGEEPMTDPNEASDAMISSLEEHLKLSLQVSEINRNTVVELDGDEMTLAELVLIRQNFVRRKRLLDKVIAAAAPQRRGWGKETPEKRLLDVSKHKQLRDEINAKLRDIDNAMQEANWGIEVQN